MAGGGYKIRDQSAVHFFNFAVMEWIDVFNRPIYQDIIVNSLKYCQEKQGLLLNAWCLMSNHLHLVGSSENGDLSGILRDFKDNQPKECYSKLFVMQKINYIHKNSVVGGIVVRAEDYWLSSAIDFVSGRRCGLLEVDILLSNLKQQENNS